MINPLWVLLPLLSAVFLLVASLGLARAEARRKRLEIYWARTCRGAQWKRRFPKVPRGEIRAFLTLFVDAFGFEERRRLCFSPDDEVLGVYHALYAPEDGPQPDGLELEILVCKLRKIHGVDVVPLWREDTTLGQLFAFVQPPAA